MTGQRLTGEDYEKFGREDCILGVGYFSGFGVWFWRLGELLQGAPGCWEFWARGLGILTESWS
jgi:hypothetical protein